MNLKHIHLIVVCLVRAHVQTADMGENFQSERANIFAQAALELVFHFVFGSPDFTVSMEMAVSMSGVWALLLGQTQPPETAAHAATHSGWHVSPKCIHLRALTCPPPVNSNMTVFD